MRAIVVISRDAWFVIRGACLVVMRAESWFVMRDAWFV